METEDMQLLDNQLCFSLYVCSKEIIRKYKPILDPFDLTYTGYIAMLALWEKDGITVKELGKRLFLDSGTLTPLLKKLETIGYVVRKRSAEDERNVYIWLTKAGKELKENMVEVPNDLVCSTKINMGEVKELLQKLHKLMIDIHGEEL